MHKMVRPVLPPEVAAAHEIINALNNVNLSLNYCLSNFDKLKREEILLSLRVAKEELKRITKALNK